MQGISQDRARRSAGNALAGGNTQGAIAELGNVGDLQSVQTLQQGQARQQADMMAQEKASQEEILGFLTQGATALLQVPPDQRQQTYLEVLRPVLLQMGYDQQAIDQIDRADKSDASLRSLIVAAGGEVQSPYANDVTVGSARVRPDRYTGAYEPVYTAPVTPSVPQGYRLTENGDLTFIPGGPADPRIVSTRAAAGRAPARGGGSSGRSSGGGSAPRPASINPAGVRWD